MIRLGRHSFNVILRVGWPGYIGAPGSPGLAGPPGVIGATGSPGFGQPGHPGPPGYPGNPGNPGLRGATGAIGTTGATGAPGFGLQGFCCLLDGSISTHFTYLFTYSKRDLRSTGHSFYEYLLVRIYSVVYCAFFEI